MSEARRRPARPVELWARLVVVMTLATFGAALGIALLLPFALGAEYTAGARSLARAVAVGGVLLSLLLSVETVLRVRGLHSYFLRAARSVDAAPPSEAAVRDAFWAPDRVALAFVLCAGGLAAVDALGLAPISQLPAGTQGAVLDLAAWLVVVLLASPLRSGLEWMLAGWLARLDPAELTVRAPRSLADTLAARAALPAASATLLAATGQAARVQSGTPLLAGLVVALAVGALAFWLARRAAAPIARELRAVASYARNLGPDASHELPASPPPGTSSAELRAALSALSERLAAVRANEERAHRTMSQAQHLKTQFLASMSHDLRSPLNSILGFSEVLLGGLDGPLLDPQRESVRAIQRAGEDLLRLLTDVLDSARLDAGRLELRRAWVPSVEILTEAVRRGRVIAAERTEVTGRPLSIEAELQPGLPPVYVDSERIVQVVVGLFGHAARAMDGGTIRLRAHVAAGAPESAAQMRVDVTDTGGGIPEGERERIFEAFRGVRGGRRLAGLGLGLALARALARAHGGDVSVASAADGTTFTVALPTDGPAPGAAPGKARRPARRR